MADTRLGATTASSGFLVCPTDQSPLSPLPPLGFLPGPFGGPGGTGAGSGALVVACGVSSVVGDGGGGGESGVLVVAGDGGGDEDGSSASAINVIARKTTEMIAATHSLLQGRAGSDSAATNE